MAEDREPALDPAWAPEIARLAAGEHADPFAILGLHREDAGDCVRVFRPDATAVAALMDEEAVPLAHKGGGFFAGPVPSPARAEGYRLAVRLESGAERIEEDPYRFGLVLSAEAAIALKAGRCWEAHRVLGARPTTLAGVEGVSFAVWAPLARRVALAGEWLDWNPLLRPMRFRHEMGVWEFFEPGLEPGAAYAFDILTGDRRRLVRRDPYARALGRCEASARVAGGLAPRADRPWAAARVDRNAEERFEAVLAVSGADWGFGEDAYAGARRLVRTALDLGFTDLRLLDLAPRSRFAVDPAWGGAEGVAALVSHAHAEGLGVVADCPLAGVPEELAGFDGSPLYEPAESERAREPDGGLRFNYARYEAANYLLCAALHLLEDLGLDGLVLHGLAEAAHAPPLGEVDGAGVDLLRSLTELAALRAPGARILAADAPLWPGLTQATLAGGLGVHRAENAWWAGLLGGPLDRRVALASLGARPGFLDAARRRKPPAFERPREAGLAALLLAALPGAGHWPDPAIEQGGGDWLRDPTGEGEAFRALLRRLHAERPKGRFQPLAVEGPKSAFAFARGERHISLVNFSDRDAEMTANAPRLGLYEAVGSADGAPRWLEAAPDVRAATGFAVRVRLPARSGVLAALTEEGLRPC